MRAYVIRFVCFVTVRLEISTTGNYVCECHVFESSQGTLTKTKRFFQLLKVLLNLAS